MGSPSQSNALCPLCPGQPGQIFPLKGDSTAAGLMDAQNVFE
jgi:hypothetical protein